jgi:hypothetical protein
MFARWMTRTDGDQSIWNDDMYRGSLISYIAKIFGQHDNRHEILQSVRLEAKRYDELDQLNRVIKKFEKHHGLPIDS